MRQRFLRGVSGTHACYCTSTSIVLATTVFGETSRYCRVEWRELPVSESKVLALRLSQAVRGWPIFEDKNPIVLDISSRVKRREEENNNLLWEIHRRLGRLQ